MARRKRTGARGGRSRQPDSAGQNAPDIYQDMLSEAGVATAVSSSPERPLKKPRRGGAKYAPASREDDVSLHASKLQQTRGLSVDKEVENLAPEDAIAVPNATVQTMQLDTDEDDEDEDVEFEDVDFNAWLEGKDTAEPEAMALELNLSAQKTSMTPSKKGPERRKPLTREEREKRTHIHQTHLLCLLSHVALRNHWCNDDKVQGYLRRHLSDKIITYLTPGANLSQFGRTESLKNGLTQAFALWKTKFEVVERGLRRSLWAEEEGHLENYEPPSDMESCHDREDFRHAAKTLQGSRDVGAQLFCALLRSVGVRARLVCSLQPLACAPGAPTLPKPKAGKPAGKTSRDEQVRNSMANYKSMSEAASAAYSSSAGKSTARRRLGHPTAAAFDFEPAPSPPKPKASFKTPIKIRESAYPVYWVEVLDVGHQKWQPADPVVTHTFWKPRALEPPITDKENSMSYVVAFEADGSARDVTRRYAKAYTAKTRKLRIENATEGGDRWWRKALKRYRRLIPDDLDQIEDNELTGVEAREPMPRNVQDFKDHPIYALERHLRRHEVLVPEATPSGTVAAGARGKLEKIYRRRDVRIARTADKWYRLGRLVKPNEIPAKWLPKKSKPKGARFGDDEEEDDDGPAGTPIYIQDQTDLYEPPPVRNGRVPKNKFGNIDVYVPSMVPQGGVHIQHEHAARAAFLAGVDYAPALMGFSFKGRHGTAVLNGVVVAEEYREAVMAVIGSLDDLEQEAEDERRRLMALRVWRRFLMGLRIRERVWRGVDDEERREADREAELEAAMQDAPSDVTEEFDMVDEDDDGDFEGGGFIVD